MDKWSKCIEQEVMKVPALIDTSTAQLLYLRLGEHHERRSIKTVRVRGPGNLLSYCAPRDDGELHPWYLNNKTAYSRPKKGHQ